MNRIALAAFLLSLPAAAETLESLSAFETVKVSDGVYAFIAHQTSSPLVSGNSLAVIGDDGVLVVDSGHFPSGTRRMLAEIRRLTPQPVRFLVNTHWHPDHNAGNSVYQDAFGAVTVISTTATRDAFISELPKYEAPAMREQVPLLKEALRSGKTRRGAPLTEAQRASFTEALAGLETTLPDLESARRLTPVLTFERDLTVHLGKREVRILFLGRGNTAGDAVIFVPDAKVIATGDLVVHPIPYAFGSFIGEWPATLEKMLALGANTFVPGHGPVLRDKSYPQLVAQLLSSLTVQAKDAVGKGLTMDQARARLDLGTLRQRLTRGDKELENQLQSFVLDPGFARAYREAKEGPLRDEN